MSRVYRVPYTGTFTAAGTDTDLLSVQPADDKPCRLIGMRLGQTSEVGDAAEEGIRVTLRRMTATVTIGSGGSAVTPVANDTTEAAAGFTARCNDTTVSTTGGTSTIVEEIAWNIRASPAEFWWPDDAYQLKARQGEVFIVRAETTPADDMTVCLTFFVEEV